MRFETFKEAKDFYNVYAKHAGFAVREGSKVKTRVYLYCMCYGVYESKVLEANRQWNKTTTRTNCEAKMRLKREKDGTLVVKEIVWEHNHRLQLTPQMLVFLHSHKNFDKTILEYVKYMQFKGIEHAQIMSILGGDDPANSRMDDVDDVLKTVNFFREMKAINREFFCDMQLDESDRVKNIFWANASYRGAYQDFGDCVTFDTTYKTNKYHMPLGVFVGTNNHLQTTFFGFALTRNEDADSFRWLFKTFLRCMRGKAPTCIITDQCPTMALAIRDAFKNTVHKLCRWHIMKKYREHLAFLYNLHKDFKDEFTSILNWPLMPTEFEAAWEGLMDRYNLHDDATMVAMWNERERWISAYFKEIFCAKMTSTQRSESMNYVLKRNYRDQKRLKLSTLFTATETKEPTKYLVRYNNPQKLSAWSQHAFQVVADPVGEIYECECKLWDHTGIFCVHVLCMMQKIKAASVPEKYILRRYTKRPNIQPTFDRNDLRTVASNKASQY
ncbi:protein FAR1-RELATED SEQUENCE 5-like [Aegilops tauschii subsp. strangulata]|uniref:protein FAR1-RELATED SEQUENCE 5-like n=1 Tax=Aegilops tauschii subsp. strangulata TaxID=200361 RepID=UPI001ABCA9A6|nr:protein FAR1-RELATED SEQUENCE 5-like [Aegilops tauschii subsp. strangulata]